MVYLTSYLRELVKFPITRTKNMKHVEEILELLVVSNNEDSSSDFQVMNW